jgi:hypothetical protein
LDNHNLWEKFLVDKLAQRKDVAVLPVPRKVDIIFEPDAEHFWLHCPYRKSFIEALAINMVSREWNKEKKAWRMPTSEFSCIYELIQQFYGPWEQVPIYGHMEGYEAWRIGS